MKKALIRAKTRDVAFQFRMGAGSPGDVNRTHPASIEPALNSKATPVPFFGFPVLIDAAKEGVRPYAAGDVDGVAYGIAVRPYPFQQVTASNFGQADFGVAPAPAGALDVLRFGYIMAQIPTGQTPGKGDPAYVRIANAAAGKPIGGIEAVDDGANTVAMTNVFFNGGPDASGVVEVYVKS